MCLMDSPAQPKTPDPPAPAAAPAKAIEPDLNIKRGKSKADVARGKQQYRVDSTGTSVSKGTGLNIPT